MKKIDISQLITILTNIGVITGIAFLGFELRQNNTELASQSRMNFYEMRSALEAGFREHYRALLGSYNNRKAF